MPAAAQGNRFPVPAVPQPHISRRRLLALLDRGRDVPLTLVSSGPGSGKTVLLSEWARVQPATPAWLTLTSADNEPRRFWRLFMSATAADGFRHGRFPMTWSSTATAEIVDWLYFRPRTSVDPLTIVIDDAHVLDDHTILDGLDRLVRDGRADLRLVLAARSDPLLPLHRYRLANALGEIRAADLAMTHDEAAALMAAHGVVLGPGELQTLMSRTEGWTAGLRLSAMRMQSASRPADFVAELAVDKGSTGEYLLDEVVFRQPDEVRRLLMATSFFTEVTPGLADAVTATSGNGARLSELARRNSFVLPLDAGRSRFRYHQLLGEVLRYLARRDSPDEMLAWFDRAADWFAAQGDLPNALYWTVRAGNVPRVVSRLVHGGLADVYGRAVDLSDAGLSRLVDELTDDAVSDDARVAGWAAVAVTSDRARATQELARIRPERLGPEVGPQVMVTAHLARLMAARTAHDSAVVDETLHRLLDPDGPCLTHLPPRALGRLQLARAAALFNLGRTDDAESLLQRGMRASEDVALRLEILGMSAVVSSYADRPQRTTQTVTAIDQLLAGRPELSAPAMLYLALARQAYIRADFAEMTREVERAAALAQAQPDAGLAAAVALARGTLLAACGRAAEARTVLHGDPALSALDSGLVAVYRDSELAQLEIALGRPNAALNILHAHRQTPLWPIAAVAAARAYLASGDLRAAQRCVRGIVSAPSPQVSRYLLVEALLTDAMIAQRAGESGRVLDVLSHAIEVADGDIVLPFVRTADVFAPILARHTTVAARWPAGPDGQLAGTDDDVARSLPTLPDPLTDRERAVLRFLATSMSTAEIADELCLSVNTVKTHLAAIYRKLSARKRREAVLRARRLELL